MKLVQGDIVRLRTRLPTVSDFKICSVHAGAVCVSCEVAGFTFRGFIPDHEVIP